MENTHPPPRSTNRRWELTSRASLRSAQQRDPGAKLPTQGLGQSGEARLCDVAREVASRSCSIAKEIFQPPIFTLERIQLQIHEGTGGNLVRQRGGWSNPFEHASQARDATDGFCNDRARSYDPSSGGGHRFTSADPIGGGYAYAGDRQAASEGLSGPHSIGAFAVHRVGNMEERAGTGGVPVDPLLGRASISAPPTTEDQTDPRLIGTVNSKNRKTRNGIDGGF